MCEHNGGVLGDCVLVFHRNICCEHSVVGRCNYLMAEAAISFSADAGPKLPKSRSPTPILASDWATARLPWVRVCVLWLCCAWVGKAQAKRQLVCTTRVGTMLTNPGFNTI